MKQATLTLETLSCPSCSMKIENAIKGLNGVDKTSVKILFNSSKARFNFNDELISINDIESAINRVGYEVLKSQVK